ncbi:DinB family protein [Ammonicoccus fulvus]|uniref:DinB family protein n=1 Tax=Ammonicoccus fulvus TaxID=3138240 RepID=A0ABZ3FM47_9ACTN
MTTELPPTPRDEKDWTWVLERRCDDCGFSATPLSEVPHRVRASIEPIRRALSQPDAATRTEGEDVWSSVEYACHIRDVCRVFNERVHAMLTDDGTRFESWDANDAAIDGHYSTQDPDRVAEEYAEAAETIATTFGSVPEDRVQNRGIRGDGMAFTVSTLASYFVHEIVHHQHDIER